MQFNLRHLFAVMTVMIVACIALVNADRFWASSSYTLVVALLLAAIVVAATTHGEPRAAAIGAAVFGWGYLIVLNSPLLASAPTREPTWLARTNSPLMTTWALNGLYNNWLREAGERGPRQTEYARTRREEAYFRVGHSLCTFLFALLGLRLGLATHRGARRSQTNQPTVNC